MPSAELTEKFSETIREVSAGDVVFERIRWRFKGGKCRGNEKIQCALAEVKFYRTDNPAQSRITIFYGLEEPLGIDVTMAQPGEESKGVMRRLIDGQCDQKCGSGCVAGNRAG